MHGVGLALIGAAQLALDSLRQHQFHGLSALGTDRRGRLNLGHDGFTADLDFDHKRFRSVALLAIKCPQVVAFQTWGDARQPHWLAAPRAGYDSGLSATEEYVGLRRCGHDAPLHGSGLDLDAIATEVGYLDGATLRTLLRERLGRGVRELRANLR